MVYTQKTASDNSSRLGNHFRTCALLTSLALSPGCSSTPITSLALSPSCDSTPVSKVVTNHKTQDTYSYSLVLEPSPITLGHTPSTHFSANVGTFLIDLSSSARNKYLLSISDGNIVLLKHELDSRQIESVFFRGKNFNVEYSSNILVIDIAPTADTPHPVLNRTSFMSF